MEHGGENQGVEGRAEHGVEDVQGTDWTKWTISDRACTHAVLRQASGMCCIVSKC